MSFAFTRRVRLSKCVKNFELPALISVSARQVATPPASAHTGALLTLMTHTHTHGERPNKQ